jgi:type II secretory pathway predicted ATPase ExeA
VSMAREGLESSMNFSGMTRGHFFEGPVHAEALARLEHLVEAGGRSGLVVGPRGTGKSTVLRMFAAEVRASGQEAILIDVTGLDRVQFLERLIPRLGVTSRARGKSIGLWTEVTDALCGRALAARGTVLIVDHLDRALSDCQQMVERLSTRDGSRAAETWILALSGRLFPLVPRAWRERNDLRIDLAALSEDESHAFVRSLLDSLGRPHDLLDAAAAAIVAASHGIPADLCRACEVALMLTDGPHPRVSGEALEAILRELRGLRFSA